MLRAAGDLIEEGGLESLTMEGVAARAGVGKPTVYRHWRNRHELAMAALIEAASAAGAPPGRDAPLEALAGQLRAMAALFASSAGRNAAAMLVSGDGESELSRAFRLAFVQARRDEGRALLLQAIAAGRIRAGVDLELALDLIYGPVFYRLTMTRAAIHAGYIDALLGEILAGLAVHRPGRAGFVPVR